MKSSIITILIWCYLTIYTNCKPSIPSFVHLCKQSDPEIDKCILNTVNDLKPHLAKGVPEMRILPLSPFKMEKLSLKTGSNLELTLTDVELGNLLSFDIKHFHIDLEKIDLDLEMQFPMIEVRAKYKLMGHLLMFDLNGGGNAILKLNKPILKTKILGKKVQKGGKEYFEYKNIDVDIKLFDGHLDFQTLFEGNKQLTDQTNTVLNENSDAVLAEFEPMVSTSFKSVILSVVKNVFDSFPADELLPK